MNSFGHRFVLMITKQQKYHPTRSPNITPEATDKVVEAKTEIGNLGEIRPRFSWRSRNGRPGDRVQFLPSGPARAETDYALPFFRYSNS